MKLLVFGSNGLVGSSLRRIFDKNNFFKNVYYSTRKDKIYLIMKKHQILFQIFALILL